ncbi:YhdP family protein [Anianabacter salinae]|uniref:YhdP family protein n=1 Tax=Anianabacter salinae TaxID=2851023 RepID=UPI00225E5B9B|nr:DUF3971 domain-containing protein [Anianabacter salinae]MBV0911692.1 hypothetical protein [Anianabacter salinae]
MSRDDAARDNTKGGAERTAPRRRRARWLLIPLAALVLCAALLWTGYLAVSGRPLTMPDWVTETAETRINAALGGPRITLADIELTIRRSGLPRLRLRDVGVFDAGGQEIARLNELGARLDRSALLGRDLRPRSLTLSGAQITLRRRSDGTFDLSLGDGLQASGTLAGLLDSIDTALSAPPLDLIQRIEADEVTILLEDARSRRVWQVTGGRLTLDQSPGALDLSVAAEVFNGTEDLAEVTLGLRSDKATSAATLNASFTNAAAADIAAQAPVLAFMQVLDAPISGALRTSLDDSGTLETLAGTLEIGAGALDAAPGAKPVGFAGGQVYFDYDPTRQRLDFRDLAVETDVLRAAATGHAYLSEFNQGVPGALVGQVALSRMDVEPAGLFATPLFFNDGATDFRLRLDPFTLDVGQAVLIDEELRIRGKGRVAATREGWSADIDLHVDEAMPRRVLAFWPLDFAPRTRDWLLANIRGGTIGALDAALRLRPEDPLRISTTFDFSGADVRFLDEMPMITGASGYSHVDQKTFSLFLDDGQITPPEGGAVNVTGSTLVVDDTDASPSIMQVTLNTESPIPAALSLLDQPPLRVITRAGRTTDMAEGRAALRTALSFPLINELTLADVAFDTRGTLEAVRSERLVPGRRVEADTLDIAADKDSVRISGAARLDGVPLSITWRQPVDDVDAPGSVDGTIALSQATLDAFGIALPDGTVSGDGAAQFSLDLPKDAAPRFSLVSDLGRVGVSIPALRWALTPAQTGRLELSGTLGDTPVVEALSLTAPGLSATGNVTLGADGGLGTARFERLRVGGWLDAGAEIVGRGAGLPPQIRVTGGTVDLRALDTAPTSAVSASAQAQGASAAAAPDAPVQVTLERLIVSDGITLTALNGNFTTSGGIDGTFGALVNGQAPIAGRVVPEAGRSAIRLTSEDGGAVMAAAGVIPNFRGGRMALTLRPGAAEGVYNGTLDVRGTRIVEAPAMTELLSAVSVIGLIDQLGGAGIGMEVVDAEFVLTPDEVRLLRSSATGPSLGITLDGVYRLGTGAMQMQGVVSPVYFLNGLGQIFTRQGEGLFGFSYTLTSNGTDTQVGVNPLSILTPGMFRDIFRRPPPS